MATKIIKALVNGVIQNIEVEDMTSPEQPLSYDERIDVLEGKHEVIITDGNLLVGNGTEELEEMTPEEVLSHINGASVMTLTTAEYEALEDSETNANTLYMLTDDEDEGILPTITIEDEGKFLRVVDGVWTAVSLPIAEDTSFSLPKAEEASF